MSYQEIRRGAATWEVHRVDSDKAREVPVHSFELLGRVVLDAEEERFYVEKVEWLVDGHRWKRIEFPYSTKDAAVESMIKPRMQS